MESGSSGKEGIESSLGDVCCVVVLTRMAASWRTTCHLFYQSLPCELSRGQEAYGPGGLSVSAQGCRSACSCFQSVRLCARPARNMDGLFISLCAFVGQASVY